MGPSTPITVSSEWSVGAKEKHSSGSKEGAHAIAETRVLFVRPGDHVGRLARQFR